MKSERFNIGTGRALEFRDTQVNLMRIQSALIAARYQARITRLEMEPLIGRVGVE